MTTTTKAEPAIADNPIADAWAAAAPDVAKLEHAMQALEAANARLAPAAVAISMRTPDWQVRQAIADLDLHDIDRSVDRLGARIIAAQARDQETLAASAAIGLAIRIRESDLAEARRNARPKVFALVRAAFARLIEDARPVLAELAGVDDANGAIDRGVVDEWREAARLAAALQRITSAHAELVTASGGDGYGTQALIDRVGLLAKWWLSDPWYSRLRYGVASSGAGFVQPNIDAPRDPLTLLRYLTGAPGGVVLRNYQELTRAADEIRLCLAEAERRRARARQLDPTHSANPEVDPQDVVDAVRGNTGPSPDRDIISRSAYQPSV